MSKIWKYMNLDKQHSFNNFNSIIYLFVKLINHKSRQIVILSITC